MKRKLELCGIRPINNIVDVTNYVLLEYGHPMHAFDLNRLDGKKIIVRTAHKGEVFKTLDGKDHDLSSDMLVIADDSKAVAIAGIMGEKTAKFSMIPRIFFWRALFLILYPYGKRQKN